MRNGAKAEVQKKVKKEKKQRRRRHREGEGGREKERGGEGEGEREGERDHCFSFAKENIGEGGAGNRLTCFSRSLSSLASLASPRELASLAFLRLTRLSASSLRSRESVSCSAPPPPPPPPFSSSALVGHLSLSRARSVTRSVCRARVERTRAGTLFPPPRNPATPFPLSSPLHARCSCLLLTAASGETPRSVSKRRPRSRPLPRPRPASPGAETSSSFLPPPLFLPFDARGRPRCSLPPPPPPPAWAFSSICTLDPMLAGPPPTTSASCARLATSHAALALTSSRSPPRPARRPAAPCSACCTPP